MGKNLELSPEIDLDEAVFIGSKSFIFDKQLNLIEAEQRRVQPHKTYTLEDHKENLQNNNKVYGII